MRREGKGEERGVRREEETESKILSERSQIENWKIAP